MRSMGVLYDYFTAPSDLEAATTVTRVGGPASRQVFSSARGVPTRRGLFGRKRPAEPEVIEDPTLAVFDTVCTRGIDPVVQLSTLEELLTGESYDDITARLEGRALASTDGGEVMVFGVSDTLRATLAAVTDERLAEVAVPWSQTEEFWGDGDPADLAQFLRDLAALSRRGTEQGNRLYCWISL